MTVEEEGARFYEALAKPVTDHVIKEVFLTLSRMELDHRDTFCTIADKLHKEDYNEYSVDVSQLIQTHLDKLKRLSFDMRMALRKQHDILEALDIGIHTEKETIEIYSSMYRVFIEKFHQVLLTIIKEEKKHLEDLSEVKRKLKQ